jgi:hypothetical protein
VTVTAIRTASGLPVLNEGAKYGLAGQIVDELSAYTEASDAGVLFSLLAGFGAMLGRVPYVQAGARQHGRIWPLLVGPTSTGRKGTSWTIASMPLWYASPSFIGNNIHGGLSTGEGLIAMVRDAEPPDPTMPRKRLDDGVADKRRLIIEPEFARTLAASRRDNNTLSSVLREAWEGSTLSISTRSRPLKATDPHITLIGHATASELRTKLSDNDLAGGLVNRFLIVGVRRSKLLPSGDKPPDELLKALGAELHEKLEIAANGPRRLHRTKEAEDTWHDLYTKILNPDDDDETPFGQAVTRGPAYVARLSLLYAVLDGAIAIGKEHVAAAAWAWDYCYGSARQIFQPSEMKSEDAQKAEAYIRGAGGEPVSRSSLAKCFKNTKSPAELDRLTNHLLDLGNVVYGPVPPKSKHATLVWAADFKISSFPAQSRSP